MPRRSLVVLLLSMTVFVGVLLLMISAQTHVVREGLPVSALAGAAAAVAAWRWSEHVDG